MCLCAEGIWCDGVRCVCVLRASGVMGLGVLCAEGIWCDGGRCVCVLRASGVMGVGVFVC